MDNWRHDAVCEMQMHNIICIKKKSVDALRTYRRAHEKNNDTLKRHPRPPTWATRIGVPSLPSTNKKL